MNRPLISLSIVSHAQSELISNLLDDLSHISPENVELIITINIPENESLFHGIEFPYRILRNSFPKGFGENHNQAFQVSRGSFFVVVNPDIRIEELNLDAMLSVMERANVGAVAPVILNKAGSIEDSIRKFPTFLRLLQRVVLRKRSPDYEWNKAPIEVDWAAGMFVMFRREAFETVGGFDSRRFFMYYEDVDICMRLRSKGFSTVLQPLTVVTHDAQRASHRNLKHLRWHLISTFRYFTGT